MQQRAAARPAVRATISRARLAASPSRDSTRRAARPRAPPRRSPRPTANTGRRGSVAASAGTALALVSDDRLHAGRARARAGQRLDRQQRLDQRHRGRAPRVRRASAGAAARGRVIRTRTRRPPRRAPISRRSPGPARARSSRAGVAAERLAVAARPPRRSARRQPLPSGRATSARSRMRPVRRARHGRRSGCGRSRRARPAAPARRATQALVGGSSIAASSARIGASSARHSTPIAPWPTAGSISSGVEHHAAGGLEPQAVQPGQRQQRRVDLAGRELAQAGVDVAAQGRPPAGPGGAPAAGPGGAARRVPTTAPCGSAVDPAGPRARDQHVARIRARQHRADRQARPAARSAGPSSSAPRGRSGGRAAPPRAPCRTAPCRRARRAAGRSRDRRSCGSPRPRARPARRAPGSALAERAADQLGLRRARAASRACRCAATAVMVAWSARRGERLSAAIMARTSSTDRGARGARHRDQLRRDRGRAGRRPSAGCWPRRCTASCERHAPFGGVVPEIAARAHVEILDRLIAQRHGARPAWPSRSSRASRRPPGRA